MRSARFYPIGTQSQLIMTCFMLHNIIKGKMLVDPMELELDGSVNGATGEQNGVGDDITEVQLRLVPEKSRVSQTYVGKYVADFCRSVDI